MTDEPALRREIVAQMWSALDEHDLYRPALESLREKQPAAVAALDLGAGREWISAAAYAALLDETAEIAGGDDRLRALGVAWSVRELGPVGRFGSMRRSWLRAFGQHPGALARLAPHLWRAVMRRNGRVRHGQTGPGFVRLVLEDAPLVRGCLPWQKILEGCLQGLLDLGELQTTVQVGSSATDPRAVDAIVMWQPK